MFSKSESASVYEGKTFLVTGASSGIGEALARALAKKGAKVLLAARNEARLNGICREISSAGGRCEAIRCDLSDEKDIDRLTERLSEIGTLDVLIHNAAEILYEKFCDIPAEDTREMFQVNFFSVLSLTQKTLPLLQRSSRPALIAVSSTCGWHGLPRLSLYCATKAALNTWMESIRMEPEFRRMHLMTVFPGVTKTPLSEKSKSKGPKPFSTTETHGLTPEEVAKKILRSYEKGKNRAPILFFNRLYSHLISLMPKTVDFFLLKYYKKKGWLL